jgi:hypothetical protein
LSALAVRLVVRDLAPAPVMRASSGSAAVIDSLLGGLRAIRGHGLVIYGLVGNLIGNLTWAMGVLLGMVLYLRATSTDPLTDYSLMMMAYGIGNLSANLVLASLKPGRERMQLVVAKFIFGIGVFLLPLMPGRASLMLVAVAPDRLRRLAEGAQERAAHALAVGEAGLAGHDVDRVAALLHHQPRGLDPQILDRLGRRLAGLGMERRG